MRKINLPDIKVCEPPMKQGQTDAFAGGAAPGNLPQWLVVNFFLPSYDPPNPMWGKEKPDGDGFAFVVYLKMEEWVEQELESRGNMSTRYWIDQFFTIIVDELKIFHYATSYVWFY
jgi:hypothetical protein